VTRPVQVDPALVRRDGGHPGQIIIMFAVFSTVMIGVLGLATDLGISFAGRRSMQNAADAAAYAGARIVAKAATTSGLSASSEVNALAGDNGFTFATGTPSVTCVYVNDAETSLGDCSATVPSTATGVKVSVTETHPTYFIRVLPGAPETSTTNATATAHVRKLARFPSDGPFLPCATSNDVVSGPKVPIMQQVGGVWQVNPAAVGLTYKIHGPQVDSCGVSNSAYKGLAEGDANRSLVAPPAQYFNYKEGVTAGWISTDVEGAQGCKSGQEVDNCVAFLPIAVNDPSHPPISDGSNKKLWTIGFLAFYITAPKSNEHHGKLIGNYIVRGPVESGWTRDYFGPIVIKLTG
jgi:Flp pilus assembly protein TadG